MNTLVMSVGHVTPAVVLGSPVLVWASTWCLALAVLAGRRAFALQRVRLAPMAYGHVGDMYARGGELRHVAPRLLEPRAPGGSAAARRRLAQHNGDVITLVHHVLEEEARARGEAALPRERSASSWGAVG